MFRKLSRPLFPLVLAVAAIAAAPAVSAAAVTVGPDQYFAGQVNGKEANAVIEVACPGPASSGAPLAGQTVAVQLVLPSSSSAIGFTGSAATSINAWLSWPTPAVVPPPVKIATFTSYGSLPIPTNISVPCSGTGVVTFVPTPGSSTSRSATVSVTFVNIAA